MIKILISLSIQCAAYFATYIFNQKFPSSELTLIVHLSTVAVLGILLKLKLRWLLLNILLPVAFLLGSTINLSAFCLFFLILFFLLYLPTIWTKVPYYPTHREMYVNIANTLSTNEKFRFLDAGCGDGALLAHLAKSFPEIQFTGVELSPLSFCIAWINNKLRKNTNVKICWGSFWSLNFSDYKVIYAFLAPPIMPELWEKCKKEMKPGCLVIINSFPLPITATHIIQLENSAPDRSGTLYLYKIS